MRSQRDRVVHIARALDALIVERCHGIEHLVAARNALIPLHDTPWPTPTVHSPGNGTRTYKGTVVPDSIPDSYLDVLRCFERALERPCPMCDAVPGDRCHSASGRRKGGNVHHKQRYNDAELDAVMAHFRNRSSITA